MRCLIVYSDLLPWTLNGSKKLQETPIFCSYQNLFTFGEGTQLFRKCAYSVDHPQIRQQNHPFLEKKQAPRGPYKTRTKGEDICQSCGKSFKEDKKGEKWIQYLNCNDWFQELCQGLMRYEPDFYVVAAEKKMTDHLKLLKWLIFCINFLKLLLE